MMEFLNKSGFVDFRHFQLYNESLFHDNFTHSNETEENFLPSGLKITIVMVYMIVCVVVLEGILQDYPY